jgi:uncharacterized protein (TIGR03067 family)
LIRYERQGKVWGPEGIDRDFEDKGRGLQLRFEGDKLFMGEAKNDKPYRLLRRGATQDHTFWLDPTKTPSRFDLSLESGIFSRGMTTYEGIYRLQGDRLEICVAMHPNTRPTQFVTDADHEWRWLLVYRRVPPPKK